MKINLSSTSYLVEKNNNWNFLDNLKNISFSNYGEIFYKKYGKQNKSYVDIKLLFLPDILDYYELNSYKSDLEKIYNIISILEKRLKVDTNPTIIGVSDYLYINIIETAQNQKREKKIKYAFFSELYKLSEKYKNLYVLDIDEIFSKYGLEKCFDNRNFYLSRCRVSNFGIEILAKNLRRILDRIQKSNSKVLLIDCDNTLWGGVVSEDGLGKIKIKDDGEGFAFFEFQKAIKKLKEKGVLIALISKNIKEDVIKVFKEHQSMVLKAKDIAYFKINWKEKTSNILELAKDLDLGLDSFVFWDDNPIEREKVRIKLKDVKVIEPDIDISNWSKQLMEYEGFSKFNVTKNDKKRTEQYQQRKKFFSGKTRYKNEKEYLKSIKIKTKAFNLDQGSLNRAVQLSQRTNQFNLRNKKYNHDDLLSLKKTYKCFMVSLKDVYGDHGIVSLVCLKVVRKKFIFIDTLLMSCRVLGRYLEEWILNEVSKIAKKNNIKIIVAEYILTKKNKIAKEFLLNNNFKKVKKNFFKSDTKLLSNIISKNNKSEIFVFNTKNKIRNLDIYE